MNNKTDMIRIYEYFFDWYDGKNDIIYHRSGWGTAEYIGERIELGIIKIRRIPSMDNFKEVYIGCIENGKYIGEKD